jgi:DNA-binding LacI/PurR family transcriptional regulator
MNIAALKEAAQAAVGIAWQVHNEGDSYRFIALANPSAILSLIERLERYEAALRELASTFDEESYPRVGSLERSAGDKARAALSNPTETVK